MKSSARDHTHKKIILMFSVNKRGDIIKAWDNTKGLNVKIQQNE